jgi:hypothetical protein
VAGVADAGLVALQVGHEDPGRTALVVGAVAPPGGAEADEAASFGLDVGDLDVEVHPVLGDLRLGDALEEELRAWPAMGKQRDVGTDLADADVAEGRGPRTR